MNLDAPPHGHIGRYKIVERLAVGGMAEVLLALDELGAGAQRLVVVKKILPHLAEDKSFVQMFVQEARIASGISHPNVVRIHKLGEQNGFPYIVMEYVPGCTFRQIMKAHANNTGFPIGVALQLGIQAAAGAHAAHEYINPWGSRQEIVHRDLSPHNLMVNSEGLVKVVDFGIAKATRTTDTTRTGVLKGKLRYLSPEQVLQRGVDRRSDIFTLCVVIWELIAGENLFLGENDLSIMQAITQGNIRPIMDIRREVPRNLAQVLEKGLSPEPGGRFTTAADLAGALKRVAHESNIVLSNRACAVFVNATVGDHLTETERSLEHSLSLQSYPSPPDHAEATATPGTAPTRIRGASISLMRPDHPAYYPQQQPNTPPEHVAPTPDRPTPAVLYIAFIAFLVASLLLVGWIKIRSSEVPTDHTETQKSSITDS